MTAAAQWARSVNETPIPAALFVWLEVPCLTQAQVLIAVGSQASLDQATGLLRAIRHESEAYQFANQTTEAAVLQALALAGDPAAGFAVRFANTASYSRACASSRAGSIRRRCRPYRLTKWTCPRPASAGH